MPTVSVTVARDVTEAIKVPRALFLPWPMGHHLARPFTAICSAASCSPRSVCLRPATSRGRYWIYRSSGQTFAVRARRSPSKGGSFSAACRGRKSISDRSRKVGTGGARNAVQAAALRSSRQTRLPPSSACILTTLRASHFLGRDFSSGSARARRTVFRRTKPATSL